MAVPASGGGAKASRLAAMLKTLARIYTVCLNGGRTNWTQAVDPRNSRPSLTPLGAPRQAGPGRRPKWCIQSTPRVVAANVWRAIGNTGDRSGHTRAPATNYKIFHSQTINRTGFKDKISWQSRDEALLKLAVKKQWDDFFTRTGDWQQYPVGPPPRRPTVDLPALKHNRADGLSGPTGQGTDLRRDKAPPPLALADRQYSQSDERCSSAASSGSGAVPLVATTLRELRELKSKAVATACAQADSSAT